jgi:soluble lytic murein transglycosylase-like protein
MIGTGASLGLSDLIEKELRRYEVSEVSSDALKMPAWMLDDRLLTTGRQSAAERSAGVEQLAGRVERWSEHITEASERYEVDRNLVAAVIAQESGGNQYAVSRAGAKGLMQLMDGTARALGVTSSFDAKQNILGGVQYLREQLDRFGGNVRLALASYNAGPSAVDKYNGIPPYRETQNYVRSVLSLKSRFAALAANKTERE